MLVHLAITLFTVHGWVLPSDDKAFTVGVSALCINLVLGTPPYTRISAVYQADTAAGKLIPVYQPNTSGRHPHRLVYQPDTGTQQSRQPHRLVYQPNTCTSQIFRKPRRDSNS